MTRRSAFAVAGGVVAALGAGIVATIVNVGVLNASEPQGPGQLRADEPVVRTVTETKRIHKKARGSGDAVVVGRPGTSTPARSNGVASASYEDNYEDHGAYEDESESEGDQEESEADEHEFDENDDD